MVNRVLRGRWFPANERLAATTVSFGVTGLAEWIRESGLNEVSNFEAAPGEPVSGCRRTCWPRPAISRIWCRSPPGRRRCLKSSGSHTPEWREQIGAHEFNRPVELYTARLAEPTETSVHEVFTFAQFGGIEGWATAVRDERNDVDRW